MSLYKRGRIWWVSFTIPSQPKIAESTGTTDKTLAQEYHDRRAALLAMHCQRVSFREA